MGKHLGIAAAGALVLIGGMGVTRLESMRSALEGLQQSSHELPAGMRSLALELERAEGELEHLRGELAHVRSEGAGERAQWSQVVESLDQRWIEREAELACRLERQENALGSLEEWSEDVGSIFHETRAMEARMASDQRLTELQDELASTTDLLHATQEQLATVRRELEHDESSLWADLMGPAVQLAGTSTVGSGVVLRRSGEHGPVLVLTAWHVVRDIFAESSERDPPIPLVWQGEDGHTLRSRARLVAHDVALDVALLTAGSELDLDLGAVLADRETLRAVHTFQEVYAVGCPLGNDPIPTRGEVSHTHHVVDGKSYWMISAPTYIGNSGGGIFGARSHRLLGIFSKIYTHGSLRPTVVPHMGLVTPLDRILDWIDAGSFARLVPVAGADSGWTVELREERSEGAGG